MVELLKSQRLPTPLKIYAGNISRFEQGQREPSLMVLLAYARAVDVAVEVLIDAELKLPDKLTPNLANKVLKQGRADADSKKRSKRVTGVRRLRGSSTT
jgi:transcriptional regulator with XRE-family HTH domain